MRQGSFRVAVAGALSLITVTGCGKRQPDMNASEQVAGETFEEFDERRDALDSARGIFAGEGCTQDCGGHEAGYAWASKKGISNPDQCGGRSWSFIEGCRAFAEQASGEGE